MHSVLVQETQTVCSSCTANCKLNLLNKMHEKYKIFMFINLCLLQVVIIVLIVNIVTANLLDKLAKPSADFQAVNKGETLKQKMADVLSVGKYFQDIFSEHPAPFEIEFGHVCENPNEWEQRFERKDFDNNRYSGKIKWGNKKGEYGEHYWDLNH